LLFISEWLYGFDIIKLKVDIKGLNVKKIIFDIEKFKIKFL